MTVQNFMLDLLSFISNELNINLNRIESALKLRQEGGTVTFIARYRKEAT
jgi:protein Tex